MTKSILKNEPDKRTRQQQSVKERTLNNLNISEPTLPTCSSLRQLCFKKRYTPVGCNFSQSIADGKNLNVLCPGYLIPVPKESSINPAVVPLPHLFLQTQNCHETVYPHPACPYSDGTDNMGRTCSVADHCP